MSDPPLFGRRVPGGGATGRGNGGGPPLVVLTDRRQASRYGVVAAAAAAVEGGAQAVVVREKDLPAEARCELVRGIRGVLHLLGVVLLVAGGDVELARRSGADGLHLAATDPWPPAGHGLVVGRSCHHAEEVTVAGAMGADYATLSPVFASASKPGYGPVLGLGELAAMAAQAALPIVALGGVTAATAGACVDAGAAGVAVMGVVMGAEDPRAAAAELVMSLAVRRAGVPATGR